MRRALDTAAPIALACGLSVRVEPQLHERRVGALSGTPTAGPDGVWPDTLSSWVAGDTGYAPPGAESFDAIRARVLPVWHRLTTRYEEQTLAIVAHGVVIKTLLLSLLPGYSVADWHRLGPIGNVAIYELAREADGWVGVSRNL
jgi:broad specificity phosphatase PhoE